MLSRLCASLGAVIFALGVASCVEPAVGKNANGSGEASSATRPSDVVEVDREGEACEAAWRALTREPEAPGSALTGPRRAAFLGRARGAATVLVRTPREAGSETATRERAKLLAAPKGMRVSRLVAQLERDKETLRSVVLREGYLYADEPEDAFELEARIKLTDLFDSPRLVLERGDERFTLERRENESTRWRTGPEYVHATGKDAGKTAKILFLDRVYPEGDDVGPPLHRDVVAFPHREGHDRVEIVRLTERGVLARLRFGDVWARAVVESDGAKLALGCIAEPRATRDRVEAFLAETAWRRKAEANVRSAVSAMVDEALPFDRPREEQGPDKDGLLRPHWLSAYLTGRQTFEVEDKTYAVFLPDGRPHPPQVCVDFVLDSFERASGAWFTPRGEKPRRTEGALDISAYDPENRRGVLGFGKFAEEHAELFAFRRFQGPERIPFAKRDGFFTFLVDHAHELRAGDVLAIQGLKRDNRVHQHAILLEEVDPLTGFPFGLADQMKAPRRRTWEGIMAEAPKRSLLYRARPLDVILRKLSAE